MRGAVVLPRATSPVCLAGHFPLSQLRLGYPRHSHIHHESPCRACSSNSAHPPTVPPRHPPNQPHTPCPVGPLPQLVHMLLSCALTHSSWLPTSRLHLFHTITSCKRPFVVVVEVDYTVCESGGEAGLALVHLERFSHDLLSSGLPQRQRFSCSSRNSNLLTSNSAHSDPTHLIIGRNVTVHR